jgi:hypothetical protein
VNPKFVTVAFLFLAACATAPAAPAPEPVAAQDDYSVQIERRADEMLAADPGLAPSGLEVSVLSVEQVDTGLFYKVQLRLPRRGHDAQEYVIYGQCQASDIDRCAGQILSGAKMLK